MDDTTIFESRICLVKLISPQFLYLQFKGNVDHTVEEFDELILTIKELMNFKPFVVINDLRNNFGGFSKEIREYLAQHPDLIKYKYAEAMLVNNLGIRMQVNFYLKFNKPNMVYKVFNDEEKAMNWLKLKLEEIKE